MSTTDPMRRYGMDHDHYDWSMLSDRPAVQWPNEKPIALWINLNLQFFPLNPQGQPIAVPGNMTMPYPDLRHYSLRDYGNRVGVFRLLDVLDEFGLWPSFAINAEICERYPALIEAVRQRGGEVLAQSWNMDTAHATGLEEADEAELIKKSLSTLRQHCGPSIRGWISPGKVHSPKTPELLRQQGIEYFCDWVNDDMPYRFRAAAGDLWALPISTELEDRFVLQNNLHTAESWAEQVSDAFDLLRDEAREQGGRILALNLHPWVLGQPHCARYLQQALRHITQDDQVWSAQPGAILDHFAAA